VRLFSAALLLSENGDWPEEAGGLALRGNSQCKGLLVETTCKWIKEVLMGA